MQPSHRFSFPLINIGLLALTTLLTIAIAWAAFDNHLALIKFFIGFYILCKGVLIYRLWQQHRAMGQAIAQAQAAEQRNALFAAAIDSSPLGIAISDAKQPDNPIIFVNRAFSQITGYEESEVLGRNCRFLQSTHTDKHVVAEIRQAVATGTAIHVTLQNYRRDRTPFWNDLRISPLLAKDGSLSHFIAMQDDVTALHETQQALVLAKEQAERSTTVKSNFMAMMSHEIRTPINGILGTLTLLNDLPLTDEAKELSETAHESAQALLTIVNDMLDFSKIEAGKLALEVVVFDLMNLVESCLTLLHPAADDKRLRLQLDYDPTLPRHVAGDPTRIKQVLLNLISNAIKFTERGSVHVQVSNLIASSSDAGVDCIIRFEISDTGIGISPEGLSKLFTEFNQLSPTIARRYGGTGLGLAICRRLITLMSGEIDVESRVGEGSKFWFVLPLRIMTSESEQVSGSASALKLAPTGKTGKILVVEDNATNQLVITKMLQKMGHECDLADHGEAAIAMVQATHYDLMLMDVAMPVMDGLSATRAIRALGSDYADLPILAMTAQSMQGDRERCLAAGMNDYLSKPVNRELLQRALAHWLRPIAAVESDSSDRQSLPKGVDAENQLDWDIIRQLAEDVGSESVGRLLDTFTKDLAERLLRLRQALAERNWAQLLHEAHALKSSSASCGLLAFSAELTALEAALLQEDHSTAMVQAAAVDQMSAAAQTSLNRAREYFA
jgi:PAS domain S-box-containing protein